MDDAVARERAYLAAHGVQKYILMNKAAGVLAAFVVFSSALVTACGSAQPAGDPYNGDDSDQTPSAEDGLAELGIGSDELIADETVDDDAMEPTAWPVANASEDETDDLIDDSGDYSEVPDVLPSPPSQLPFRPFGSGARVDHVDSLSFSCPENPLHSSCACRGSLYNCQYPNNQPGRNRYLPPEAIRALDASQTAGEAKRLEIIAKLGQWDLAAGTELYDGAGVSRGVAYSTCFDANLGRVEKNHACVKINFGQVKVMRAQGMSAAEKFVYAFSVTAGGVPASGWVPRNAITDPAFKAYDTPPRSASSFATTSYVLKSAEDYGAKVDTFNPGGSLPTWAGLKVGPGVDASVDESAGDYLLRAHGVLNLAYQTPSMGGAADDTFIVQKNAVAFRRARSIDGDHKTIVKISLYHVKDALHAGLRSVGRMYFVYGEVAGRFGWIAVEALKQGNVADAASAGGDSCAGKPDGLYCFSSDIAFQCTGGVSSGAQYCPGAGQTCVGPNGPGAQIACN